MTSPLPERPVKGSEYEGYGTVLDAEVRKIVLLAMRQLAKRIVTGAYTVVAEDAVDRILHSTASSPVTITLPAGLPQEVAIPWRQAGPGQITFVGASGMTVVSRGSVSKSAGQWAGGSVTCVSDSLWLLEGDVA